MKLSFLFGARLKTHINLFIRHKCLIRLKYLPSFLFHLLLGIINSLLSIPDLFWKDKGMPERITFIVGHFRTGTTHLLNLMTIDGHFTSPNTYQCVFPESFLTTERFLAPLLDKIGPGVRPMDNMKMRMNNPQEEEIALTSMGAPTTYLPAHFPETGLFYMNNISFKNATDKDRKNWKRKHLKFVKKLVKKHGPNIHLLLKSPPNTARIPLLLEMYPTANFVYIHRDPYRTIPSTIHMFNTWYKMVNFQHNEQLKKEVVKHVFETYELIHRDWLNDMKLIHDNKLISISFEELQTDPLGTLDKIYSKIASEKLDKVKMKQYLDSIKTYKKNKYEPLSGELIAMINEKLGFVFEAHGYDRLNTEQEK